MKMAKGAGVLLSENSMTEDSTCTGSSNDQPNPFNKNYESSAQLSHDAIMESQVSRQQAPPEPLHCPCDGSNEGVDTQSQFTFTSRDSARSADRRKRRDDCSTHSEESASRRRRLNNQHSKQRWLNKTTPSDAPLKPRRSGDGLPDFRRAANTERTGTGEGPREVFRGQNMSLPPVRPIRTCDDSDNEFVLSPQKSSVRDKSEEYDPDMFASLMQGGLPSFAPLKTRQSSPGNCNANGNNDGPTDDIRIGVPSSVLHAPVLSGHESTPKGKDPPRRPRRSSDAKIYLHSFHKQQTSVVIPSNVPATDTFSSSLVSPKPPAKPRRSLEKFDGLEFPSPPDTLDESPTTTSCTEDAKAVDRSSNAGPLVTDYNEEMEVEDHDDQQDKSGKQETKASRFVQEYDRDLFVRLLHGEACNDAKPVTPQSSTEELPKPGVCSDCCTYDRFDNAAHCSHKGHLEGQLKSSHPPMRPRRSFDETMLAFDNGITLGQAAAAAVKCSADLEAKKKPVCIVGGKRRHPRHTRRSTLPLSQSQAETDKNGIEAPDPTHEIELCRSAQGVPDGELPEERPTDKTETDPRMPHQKRRSITRRFTMPSNCRADDDSPISKKPRVSRSISLKTSRGPPAA